MTITLEQIINFLLEAPMFGDLDAAELSEIVHIMQIQRVREGHTIFREGDPGDAWYVVYSGEVGVYKTELMATLGTRACFGEMAIVDHGPRSAAVIAHAESTLFRFPRRDFEELLDDDNLAAFKLVYEMAKVLCKRIRALNQQVDSLTHVVKN
jgi:CRP-like cAMP-binding protein